MFHLYVLEFKKKNPSMGWMTPFERNIYIFIRDNTSDIVFVGILVQ